MKYKALAFVLGALLIGCSPENNSLTGVATGDAESVIKDSIPNGLDDSVFSGSINGFSQKGPVLAGASVVVQELDSATMLQTGKSFRGKVVNDNGEFSVENMNLKSPYVLLEVNGYFRNEITGRNSDGPVFMKAIAEVGEHSLVNINLLTHLEYERVQKLIEQNKSIPEAKLIADREIFSAFYGDALDPKNYEKMENLNIFGKSENDAALLAINVLLLGEGSEAEFMENFAKLGEDLAEDGVWNDSLLKARIADVACEMDLDGKLPTIRKNIEDWKITDEVVAFEPYVKSFWYRTYGLGVCDASNLGEQKENTFAPSAFWGAKFTCDESGRWVTNLNRVRAGCDSCGVMVDPRDNHKYRTIKIGGLNWMGENLAYRGYDEGRLFNDNRDYGFLYKVTVTNIIYGEPAAYDNVWTIYLNDDYGHNIKSLHTGCPDGWRLPTNIELSRLLDLTSDNNYELLLSKNGWNLLLDNSDTIYYLSSTNKNMAGYGQVAVYAYYFMQVSENKGSLNATVSANVSFPEFFIRCVEDGPSKWEPLSAEKVVKDSVVDERDGKVYNTLQFGDQVWMAENMEYAVGDSLLDGEKRCSNYLGLSPSYALRGKCDIGWRYNWEELQEACPEGWRVPSRDDVNTLLKTVGSATDAGALLTTGLTDSQDAYGFSAMATVFERGGCTLTAGGCGYIPVGSRFWTADSANGVAYHWYLDVDGVTVKKSELSDYLPVRCMKDI